MCTVIIGNPVTEHVQIEVAQRAHPRSDNYWDSNWLNSAIHISSGGFTGRTSACLRADEFKSFLEELEALNKTLEGTAKYTSLEEWIEMEIVGDGKGHLVARGYIIDRHCEPNTLNFWIDFDQTYLPQTLDGLRQLLKKYPVLGTEKK